MDKNIYANRCQSQGHQTILFSIPAKNPKTGLVENVSELMCGACGATLEEIRTEPRGFKPKRSRKDEAA
jgi:hypothetical protein